MDKLPPINEAIRSLFEAPQPINGDTLRDEGIARIAAHNEPWHTKALARLTGLDPGTTLTSDDLHTLMQDDEPRHPNSYGAAMRAAAELDILEIIGFAKSTRAAAHARRILLYRRVALSGNAG